MKRLVAFIIGLVMLFGLVSCFDVTQEQDNDDELENLKRWIDLYQQG